MKKVLMYNLFLIVLFVHSIAVAAIFDEAKYLNSLREIDIYPQVTMNDGVKIFTTKFSILTINSYPSTNSASCMIIPVNDSAEENFKSMCLVFMYAKSFINNDFTDKLMRSITNSIKSKTKVSFVVSGYKFIIHPPDKKALLPTVVVDINKIK